MPDYIVQWKYRSGLGGPWLGGERVGLDEKQADAINNDSPGVLRRVGVEPDNLTAIADIGAFEAEGLNTAGVLTFAQLLSADPAELGPKLLKMNVFAPQLLPEGVDPEDPAALAQYAEGIVRGWQDGIRALEAAKKDRMVRRGQRRDRGGGETINKKNFKAVRGD